MDGRSLINSNSYMSNIINLARPPSRLLTRRRKNNPSVGNFINHFLSVVLITSHVLVKLKAVL